MNTFAALQNLKESLQAAAAMCGPSSIRGNYVYEEEDFDSADLEEEDLDQCVGVDARAEELEAETFLDSDDVEWHSSALWLLSKEGTIEFLSRALFAHLSPLYMSCAPLTAKEPHEIIPDDIKLDIEDLLIRFIVDNFENTMSVQDVNNSLSAGIRMHSESVKPDLISPCW
jgi:hypothetical protein